MGLSFALEFAAMMRALALLLLAAACGTAQPGGMSGPTLNNSFNQEDAPGIQSNAILARDARTNHAVVQHVLISWKDLAESYEGRMDPRAMRRSRAEADDLAVSVLEQAQDGEDFEHLMAEYSEDLASADSGGIYDVTPDAGLVFEFKRLGLRLDVEEIGLVKTVFGWHVIKRVR